jgi:hypothetical protein
MPKQLNRVYSGDTFSALMRLVHEDLLLSDSYYRAEYNKAQQEKRDAITPHKRG